MSEKKTNDEIQPEETQADYVIINNGSIGPVTMIVTPHKLKMIQKVKGQTIKGKFTLTPGINRIPANVWNVIREDAASKIVSQQKWSASDNKNGLLLEVNYNSKKVVKKGPKNKEMNTITTEAEIKSLKEYTYDDQETFIQNCYNKETLDLWKKEKDLPEGIYNLITKQIEEMNKPPEKR